MSRILVGIRHKGEVYIAEGHPKYGQVGDTTASPSSPIREVDTIEEVREPSGAYNWMQLVTRPKAGDFNGVMTLEIRIDECDQFVYVEDE